MFKRYRHQVDVELMLRDKNKIDGAYLLLKRLKNRFKALDETIKGLNEIKANKTDVA